MKIEYIILTNRRFTDSKYRYRYASRDWAVTLLGIYLPVRVQTITKRYSLLKLESGFIIATSYDIKPNGELVKTGTERWHVSAEKAISMAEKLMED